MRQSTNPSANPSRVLRLWLDLVNTRGEETSYKVLPRTLSHVRLIKTRDGDNVECYDVEIHADGAVTCSCPANQQHYSCKHADALIKTGLLQPEGRKLLAQQQAFFEARVAELDSQLAAERIEHAKTRAALTAKPARRSRKAVHHVA